MRFQGIRQYDHPDAHDAAERAVEGGLLIELILTLPSLFSFRYGKQIFSILKARRIDKRQAAGNPRPFFARRLGGFDVEHNFHKNAGEGRRKLCLFTSGLLPIASCLVSYQRPPHDDRILKRAVIFQDCARNNTQLLKPQFLP